MTRTCLIERHGQNVRLSNSAVKDRIGLDVALRGLELDEEWWKRFAARAAADHTALFDGVFKVFLTLIESKR